MGISICIGKQSRQGGNMMNTNGNGRIKKQIRGFMTGMAGILLGVLCLGGLSVHAEDFSDMLGPQEDGTYGGMSVEDGYDYEVPGHWQLTDTLHFDPAETEYSNGERTLRLSREENSDKMLFVYDDAVTYGINPSGGSYSLSDRYYTVQNSDNYEVADTIYVTPIISRDPEDPDATDDIRMSYALADLTYSEDGTDHSFDNMVYLTDSGKEFKDVSLKDIHYSLNSKKYDFDFLEGVFETGQTDGQKRYIMFDIWDPSFEGSHMITAYEYTWADDPETFHKEPEYGPIEYFPMDNSTEGSDSNTNTPLSADSTAGETIAALALIFLVPLVLIIVIIVVIVKLRKRSKNRKGQ